MRVCIPSYRLLVMCPHWSVVVIGTNHRPLHFVLSSSDNLIQLLTVVYNFGHYINYYYLSVVHHQ